METGKALGLVLVVTFIFSFLSTQGVKAVDFPVFYIYDVPYVQKEPLTGVVQHRLPWFLTIGVQT